MSARSLILGIVILYVVPLTAWADDGWQFRLTPYLWFTGLKGDVSTIPGAPAAPIDISPSDAIFIANVRRCPCEWKKFGLASKRKNQNCE